MEPVLGEACGAVGRKSFLSNALLIAIWGCWCQAMRFLFVGHGKWCGSQRRPCMLGGGQHLTEMELNW